MSKMTPEELEQFIHQNLRSLPTRRAPRSLELRVMAAIGRQALIPWYHKSWSHWPAAIRASFLAVTIGVTGAVLAAFHLGLHGVEQSSLATQAGERLRIFASLYHVAAWIADLGVQAVGHIPTVWLYGGMAAIALMYATFFGLGAFAYRTLYRNN